MDVLAMTQQLRALCHSFVNPGLRKALTKWSALGASRAQLRAAARAFAGPGLRKALNKWNAIRVSYSRISRVCKAFRHRAARRALTTWIVAARTLRIGRDLLRPHLRQKGKEVEVLEAALKSARDAADAAVAQAGGAVRAAEEELRRHTVDIEREKERLAAEAAASAADRTRLGREVAMLDGALERQRAEVAKWAEGELLAAKREWLREAEERERKRDMELNELRLKLGLAKTHSVSLLVGLDAAQDGTMLRRLETPTGALHSLVARARGHIDSVEPRLSDAAVKATPHLKHPARYSPRSRESPRSPSPKKGSGGRLKSLLEPDSLAWSYNTLS